MLFNQITFLFAPRTAIYTPHSRNANSFFFFPFILCGCLYFTHAAASYCCYYFYCYTSLLLYCSFHQNTISAQIEIQQIHEKRVNFSRIYSILSVSNAFFPRKIRGTRLHRVLWAHHGKLKWAKYFEKIFLRRYWQWIGRFCAAFFISFSFCMPQLYVLSHSWFYRHLVCARIFNTTEKKNTFLAVLSMNCLRYPN